MGVTLMKKTKITIFICSIVTIIFGIWGQSIAYFFSDYLIDIYPIYYLTAITIISILALIIAILLSYKLHKNKQYVSVLQLIILIIGIITSFWSLFVLIMWWS